MNILKHTVRIVGILSLVSAFSVYAGTSSFNINQSINGASQFWKKNLDAALQRLDANKAVLEKSRAWWEGVANIKGSEDGNNVIVQISLDKSEQFLETIVPKRNVQSRLYVTIPYKGGNITFFNNALILNYYQRNQYELYGDDSGSEKRRAIAAAYQQASIKLPRVRLSGFKIDRTEDGLTVLLPLRDQNIVIKDTRASESAATQSTK